MIKVVRRWMNFDRESVTCHCQNNNKRKKFVFTCGVDVLLNLWTIRFAFRIEGSKIFFHHLHFTVIAAVDQLPSSVKSFMNTSFAVFPRFATDFDAELLIFCINLFHFFLFFFTAIHSSVVRIRLAIACNVLRN